MQLLRRLAPLVFTLLTLFTLAAPRSVRADDVDDYVEAQRTAHKIAGLSLAVVRDGKIVKISGYGLANVELGASATPTTVYPIGALSETFTGALALMLAAESKLSLDAPVARYVASAPAKVTIRRLIDHTSGFATPVDDDRLLIAALEKVGGAPCAVQLRDRLLTARTMNATRPNDPTEIVPNRAAGYRHVNGARRNVPAAPASGVTNLLTTVGDLAHWEPPPAPASTTLTESYGGWIARTTSGHRVLARGGATTGFRAQMSCYPDDGLKVIVLTNDGDFPLGTFTDGIAGLFVPGISSAALPAIPDDSPRITAKLRQIVKDLAQQTASDPNWFTPDVWHLMQPRFVNGSEYRALGVLQSIDLLESRDHPDEGIHVYRYRLTYASNTMDVKMATDKSGKISALTMHIE